MNSQIIGDCDPRKWEIHERQNGNDFERQILDESAYYFTRRRGSPRFLPLQPSLEKAAYDHFSWDPRDKKYDHPARRMLTAVEMEFYFQYGSIPEIDMYRTVGTSADLFHGVDCFFCIRDTLSVALVDLTLNPLKVHPRTVRHIFFRPEDLEEKRLHEFARHVMDILMMSMKATSRSIRKRNLDRKVVDSSEAT